MATAIAAGGDESEFAERARSLFTTGVGRDLQRKHRRRVAGAQAHNRAGHSPS